MSPSPKVFLMSFPWTLPITIPFQSWAGPCPEQEACLAISEQTQSLFLVGTVWWWGLSVWWPHTRSKWVSRVANQVPRQVMAGCVTCLTPPFGTWGRPTPSLSSHIHSGVFCESRYCFLLPSCFSLLFCMNHSNSGHAVLLHKSHTGQVSQA